MHNGTLVDLVAEFKRRGGETAYLQRRGYRTVRWSYRAIAESACQFASELEARGIHHGDKVFLWGEDCAEWVIVFLGCLLRGAVVVPMDRIASADFARKVFEMTQAKLCVCSRRQLQWAAEWPVLVLEDLPQAIGKRPRFLQSNAARPEDAVEIVFTSGTTAEPKGVVITHRNISANLQPLEQEIRKYLKYEKPFHPLRFLNLLPLSHVFGQFLSIFVPQTMAGTVVFQDSLNPSEIISTIRRERVSVLVSVPRILDSLRAKLERDLEAEGKLSRFRAEFDKADGEKFIKRWWRFRKIHNRFGWKFWAFISGGAALDSETEKFFSRLSFVVIQGYGLTETTSLVSVNHPFKLGKGSIGKVLAGREVKLDAHGEILVRGENIARGYVQGGNVTPAIQSDEGWFHTGDLGELDSQGNLYFKGRKKNVIVTPEGMNIYPEDLESALRRRPEVNDCVVVSIPAEKNAVPCAVLLLKDRSQNPEPVIRMVNQNLAGHQQIRTWVVWPGGDFPRTSTQKPRMQLIRDFVQEQLRTGAHAGAPEDAISALVSSITGRKIGQIAPHATLAEDLNLSSIERVELLSALEDRFQVDLNESRFTAATTVGDIEQMLRRPAVERKVCQYPKWPQHPLIRMVRLLVYYLLTWPATLLMAPPKIRGSEKLSSLSGPVLFISNHITQVDVGFVLFGLPARFRHDLAVAMSAEILNSMRNPPPGQGFLRRTWSKLSHKLVLGLFNVFPLPQQGGFRESFEFAGESADRGYSILVFPEGRRTQDGRMSPFRSGIGVLARKLNVPVVPIRIEGLFELKQRRKKFAGPGCVTVTFGDPAVFAQAVEPEVITEQLESRMMLL